MTESAIATSDPLALTQAINAIDQDELLITTNQEVVVKEADHEQSVTGLEESSPARAESDWPMVSGQLDQAVRQFHQEIRGIR